MPRDVTAALLALLTLATMCPPAQASRPADFRLAATVLQDTVYFGGTTWAADSLRWEALSDSVWTFDTGVGSSINTGQNPDKPLGYHQSMEGWVGMPPTHEPGSFERTATCALAGGYSLWAGFDAAQLAAACRSFAGGQGYGNNWHVSRSKTFTYPGSGNITLAFTYAVECEPSYDDLRVLIEPSGAGSSPVTLATYSGVVSGTASIVLSPGVNLRSTPGPFRIRFVVESDGAYSDEDGGYSTTCGHSRIDDVRLTGAVASLSDFEAGDDGWALDNPAVYHSDLSTLADAADLPVVEVPGPCAISDSVLVFHTASGFTPHYQDHSARSPWIDLARHGCADRPGKLVSFDLYWRPDPDSFFPRPPALWIQVRSYPAPCAISGGTYLSEFRTAYRLFGMNPFCTSATPVNVDISSLVDAAAEQVQIAVGVFNYCGFHCADPSSTPWFDNVRFGVYGAPTSGLPEATLPPAAPSVLVVPNPFGSQTHLVFELAAEQTVRLSIVNVTGGLVRELANQRLPAGRHDFAWDARDQSGRRVPAGLYFYRLDAISFRSRGRLVVLK